MEGWISHLRGMWKCEGKFLKLCAIIGTIKKQNRAFLNDYCSSCRSLCYFKTF